MHRSTSSLAAVLLTAACSSGYGGKTPGERQLEALRRQQAISANGEQQPVTEGPQELYVAAGCFWGVELAFARVPGVVATEVGYVGGHTPNPTYRDISRGDTMHAETVKVTYDPALVSLETLFNVFFDVHDPTTKNRQGNDVGTQYRSAIFYRSEAMRAAAHGKVATTLEKIDGAFTPAEDYHQAYLAKGGQSAAKGEEAPIRCYG
jgi:peptide-methionine (S)-S-oxide reductase